MTPRERHAAAGPTAALAVPPKHTLTTAAVRSAPTAEVAPAASHWEVLYRSVSPAEQADLLALARRQGLLYAHQLPAVPSASRTTTSADEPRAWNLLGKMLAGQVQQLEPVRPTAGTVHDEALDLGQRLAVASALATPDLCLVQGAAGTGKSRAIAEIVTQAARRGDRVLLLAAHAAAVDRVLEQVADREAVCPIRCLAADEKAEQLASPIRALMLAEKATALRQQSLTAAREGRQAAEMQCARRRHEEGLWPQLRELAQGIAADRAALAQAEEQFASVPTQVAAEVEAGDGASPVARDVKALRHALDERLAKLAADAAAAEAQKVQEHGKLAALDADLAALRPLAEAKQQGRWWSPAWWKATFKGAAVARQAELQAKRQEQEAALAAAEQRIAESAAAKSAAAEEGTAACQARAQAEIDKRQKKHRACADDCQSRLAGHQSAWDELCRQIDVEALRPAAQSAEAADAAQAQWSKQRQEDEARCALMREWVEYLETSSEQLAAKLPGYANLVAGTPAAVAADPHFGDAGSSGGSFDLLVLDEADHLTESDFLKAARRARAWVLVGEPAAPGDAGHRGRNGSGRGHYFHKLWDHLHCDPGQLPYTWFRDGDRLGCRLRPVSADQRRWLEAEPLADAPDVELRILALPHTRAVLAEVVFPAAMALPEAKSFLCRELQEITVQVSGRCLHWQETPERVAVHFGEPHTAESPAVALDNGVREVLTAAAGDACRTCRLEFDRAAGWDRAGAEKWLDQHLRLRDLGRTALLEVPHRMAAPLAAVLADLLAGGGRSCAGVGEPVVEFVPVMNRGRSPARGPRQGEPVANGGLPTTGSGLEIDLSAPRQCERLPHDLRAALPPRGFVNLPEARAVVRRLEALLKPPGSNGHQTATPSVLVIALFPAQAELIRHFLKQSPALAAHAGYVAVGAPGCFRHREADVVLVSLTRSHSHRAVAYGEGPAALALALTRARRRLVLFGDPGNLVRRSQWQGVLDHLDEAAAQRECHVLGQLTRYLHGHGPHPAAFRFCEGSTA
jgi:hypothetical protein